MKKLFLTLIVIAITAGLNYILTPRPFMVHWHANFAMYIDGKAEDFSTDNYMEETSRCNVTTDVKPQDRIHLHENKGQLVHVHMAASTWGDLFTNLHWGIGPGYLSEPLGVMHTATGNQNLYYFINGKIIDNPANEIVKSTDRLLVWYGTGSEAEVQAKADSLVAKDADEYNHKADPASCSTNTYGWLSPIAEPIAEWIEHGNDHK